MKHMKVTKKSNAQFAISAGLSALMVCSSLGVAPVLAVADPAPKSAVKDFSKIAQQVQTYDAAKLHPNATQEQLDKLYPTTGDSQSKITVKNVKNMKAKLDQEQKVIDGNKLAQPGGYLEQVTKDKNQASHDLHEKYKALEKAENELEKAKSVDYLADLDQDAPQELKDKALSGYNAAVEAAQKVVVSAQDEIAKATKVLQQKQLLQITVQLDALKSQLATKVPNSTMLSYYEKWLAGKKAELEKLKTIDLGDFSEEYLMIPREEAEQTQTWEALNKKTDEVKNRIKTLEQKIKNVKDNPDYKSITEQIKDLETQQAYLKKELSISGRLSLGEVLGGISADDILNNVGKLHIASIEDLTRATVDPAIETLAQKAEKEGLSFTAKQIRKAKTLDGANNLLKEAEKSAIETLAQKAEKEGLSFTAKQIRKAKTVEGARALLKFAEDSKLNNKPENKPEAPEPDNSGDSTTSGDSSHDNTSMSKEKAQAKKTPKTSDVLATLLPMLGVVLGGTSIAFGKHMRH